MFSKSGKNWAWRLGWKFSGRKSGSARTELYSQIYRGETSGTQPENSALHSNGVMTFHLLSERRGHVAYSEGKLRTIFIDYCFYALKGQNVLWFPLAQMWWVTDISTWIHTVKKAVELLDVPSRNTSLMLKKYNGNVEFFCLSTYVLFFPLCHRMKKFDVRAV